MHSSDNSTGFDSLRLIPPILKAVKSEGYLNPTPIQSKAIPLVLAKQDVLACAQTGTGKTAAFALPILQLLDTTKPKRELARNIRVLILTPTRELASQIAQSFSTYGKELAIRNTVVFGGVGQNPQVKAIRQGVDVLIATPGRLLDLLNQRLVHFQGLEIFVLDEADRMLDMGFIHDVRRIITAIPKTRQTLFFSATMPPEIRKLSEQILTRPVRIEVTPVASTAEKIDQSVFYVDKKFKTPLLIHLLKENSVQKGLVFTRTKRDANKVSDAINAAGIRSEAIHGATDIAARGIDIDQVTHVFNHDIPNVPETYVHRIGRTARAGQEGRAVSLCAGDEKKNFSDIERLIRLKVKVMVTPTGLVPEPRSAGGGQFNSRGNSGGQRQPHGRSRDSQKRSQNNRWRGSR
jgi:ATP-dependent RNA helicase RhlE